MYYGLFINGAAEEVMEAESKPRLSDFNVYPDFKDDIEILPVNFVFTKEPTEWWALSKDGAFLDVRRFEHEPSAYDFGMSVANEKSYRVVPVEPAVKLFQRVQNQKLPGDKDREGSSAPFDEESGRIGRR
jgi:hypothetical protein